MTEDLSEQIRDVHRRSTGRLTAGLTRLFGAANFDLAEDVVQEAFVAALEQWTDDSRIPEQPEAWLFTVARRKALDAIRRRRFTVPLPDDVAPMLTSGYSDAYCVDQAFSEERIEDELLRLMFVCAHPLLPQPSQVALVLKALCGFTVPDIARAYLTSEETIAKRIYRAKELLRERRIAMEMPEPADLPSRRDGVLAAIYLICTEGHSSASGDALVRPDVLQAAFTLSGIMAEHPAVSSPEAHALNALTAFHLARAAARLSTDGEAVLLPDQDRGLWSRERIEDGVRSLSRSASGPVLTAYHLEAAIAMTHCTAATYASTDWEALLRLYDLRYGLDGSPIVALNRAIVVAELHGPRAGLDAVRAIPGIAFLSRFHLLAATLAELHSRLGEKDAAITHYCRALQLSTAPTEKRLLQRKLQAITES
jgi:RNA polymerase sigma-70 factor (ECF subfamily)